MARAGLLAGLWSVSRTPAASFGAMAVLALGTGAVTALFSLVYAVFINPLPYTENWA